MVTLVCAVVGEEGSAFSVEVDENKLVDLLKDAIKTKNPATIKCDARELTLFLAKKDGVWLSDDDTAALKLEEGEVHDDIKAMIDGEKMRATWTIQDVLDDKNMPVPHTRQIHVLVIAPNDRVEWTTTPEECPQLIVDANADLIKLPPVYLAGTGVGRRGRAHDQPLVLYRRDPLIQQWNKINCWSIQSNALLWIVGPPGTGKSSAALAFAFALDRSRWDVVWIHYSRDEMDFKCVRLKGNRKETCVIDTVEQLKQLLDATSTERETIVFLDGYVRAYETGEAVRAACLHWFRDDKNRRRFVCVCSMAAAGKLYDTTNLKNIPVRPGTGDRQGSSEDVDMTASLDDNGDMAPSGDILEQMLFELHSWRLEEYEEAICKDTFFRCVEKMFPRFNESADPERQVPENEIIKLVREKYFVAGGNVRLMFDFTTEDAIKYLDAGLGKVGDIHLYVGGRIGDASPNVVNRLLARYDRGLKQLPDIRLVSNYVMRIAAITTGPENLIKLKLASEVNPSVDGFFFETWFFSQLYHGGITWTDLQKNSETWKQSNAFYFDPDKEVKQNDKGPWLPTSMDTSMWLAPVKWNQGGYDAVFVNKDRGIVRFVQVTRAGRHHFDADPFVKLLNKFAGRDLGKITVVELCYVVPEKGLPGFTLPVDRETFTNDVVKVASSSGRRTRQSGPDPVFNGCVGKVVAIGVGYEITTMYHAEADHVLPKRPRR